MLAVGGQGCGLAHLEWGGPPWCLGIVLSLVQSRLEGKRAIPATLLWLPAMPLALYGLGLMQIQGWLGGLLQMVLLGSAFAHLMLLRARHRLQAFNLLLQPCAAPGGARLRHPESYLAGGAGGLAGEQRRARPADPRVVTQAGLLVAALLLWFSPIYRQQGDGPVVVSVTLCGLIIAQIAATSVLQTSWPDRRLVMAFSRPHLVVRAFLRAARERG